MRKTNKVVRVSFSGGFLGLFFGSQRGRLERVISTENQQGWNLAEVVSDNPNLILIILRIILLLLTLGLWTLSTGHLLIFEKEVNEHKDSIAHPISSTQKRMEPSLA